MDPHSFIARAEAQRWLGIAEKLLMNRDLVGSKTFAIRAKESDPRLELADQILAITDTLMAADKRVGANNNQPDWYSILQLVQLTHDSELIVNQYRRLALLLNPSQTQLPYADQAFQLVSEAWSVLSNPMRKSIYDDELNFSQQQQQHFNPIRFTHEVPPPQQQHQFHQPAPPPPPQQQQQHQHNFFSPHNVVGTSREQERPERPFVIRPHQQHNFLSQHTLSGSDYEQEQPTRPSFQSQPTQQQPHYQQQQQQQRQQPQVQHRQPPPPQPQPQIQSHPQPQIQSHPQPPPQPPPQQPTPPPQQPTPPPQQPTPPPQQPTPPPQQPTPPPQQPMPPPQQQPPERNTSTPDRQENNNGVREDRGTDGRNEDGSSTFWTACPFCFYMYEYLKVYAECTLRCQNCKRAFQAVEVQSPPLISEGKEAHYHCWGFFPLGISKSSFEKNKGNGSGWSPFSAMFAGPKFKDFQDNMKPKRNYYKGPRLYIDDVVDDVFAGISEPSDDSDFGWRSTQKKKKAKTVKSGTRKKGSGRKKKQALGVNMAHSVNMGNGENVGEGFPVQEDVLVPNVPVVETSKKNETNKKAETSKKAVGTVPRRQSGRVVKELGKLDLNVEFNNNDGEEPAPGMTAGNRGGHREEDNIEGIGFFEGLDEFLSSLPILSVVGDDKVKAA